jgi:general secretion pathway protein D
MSLPVLGHLFTRTKREIQETDIVMTMTPHIVRRPELTDEDLRSFQIGSEATPGLFEVPAIPPVDQRQRPSEDRKIEPIRPPSPAPTPTPRP